MPGNRVACPARRGGVCHLHLGDRDDRSWYRRIRQGLGSSENVALCQRKLLRPALVQIGTRIADLDMLQADTELPARPLVLRAALESPVTRHAHIEFLSRELC